MLGEESKQEYGEKRWVEELPDEDGRRAMRRVGEGNGLANPYEKIIERNRDVFSLDVFTAPEEGAQVSGWRSRSAAVEGKSAQSGARSGEGLDASERRELDGECSALAGCR